MVCTSVELSETDISPSISPPSHPEIPLHPCTDCGAPMLLMSVTYATHHQIKLRKTYECIACKSVELLVAPLFE